MEWWNGFTRWLTSTDGEYVVSQLVVPAAAIIVAGLLAAWIARGAVRGLLAKHDRELKVAAIAGLIDAAEQASVWNSLTPQEQILADRGTGQADIQVRLLPIKGADVAANWAAHALADMKRNSATFGYQVEPAVIEFRDRLVEWQQRPARARRVFQSDLDRWVAEDASVERELIAQQDAWVAQQHHAQYAAPSDALQAGAPHATGPSEPAPTQAVPVTSPAATSARVPARPAAPLPGAAPVASAGAPVMSTAVLEPTAPLPPTHEPRPTVQQVASGTGTRGVSPHAGPEADRSADGAFPPVNAFPPRAGSAD